MDPDHATKRSNLSPLASAFIAGSKLALGAVVLLPPLKRLLLLLFCFLHG